MAAWLNCCSELAHARVFYVKQRLRELEDLGLVVCIDEVWKATWTGAGVSNWRTQLLCAEQGKTVDEPREGEKGPPFFPWLLLVRQGPERARRGSREGDS